MKMPNLNLFQVRPNTIKVITNCNDYMISDRHVLANSVDPDMTAPEKEQSDQGPHCLPFPLHFLDIKTTLFKFLIIKAMNLGVRISQTCMVLLKVDFIQCI